MKKILYHEKTSLFSRRIYSPVKNRHRNINRAQKNLKAINDPNESDRNPALRYQAKGR